MTTIPTGRLTVSTFPPNQIPVMGGATPKKQSDSERNVSAVSRKGPIHYFSGIGWSGSEFDNLKHFIFRIT